MLSHEVPPFDVLSGMKAPYEGFGPVIAKPDILDQQIRDLALSAQRRVEDTFKVHFDEPAKAPSLLEACIRGMWEDGWQPDAGGINLFTTDFGLILTAAIQRVYGGVLVTRSKTELNHLSVFWDEAGIEAFPFHKNLKRLFHPSGESIDYFFRGLSGLLNGEGV